MSILRTLFIAALIIAAELRCSMQVAGGNSSETGTVTAVSSRISVTTISPCSVWVYAIGYQPFAPAGLSAGAFADSGDTATFTIADTGRYNVLIRDTVTGGALFVRSIPLFPDSSYSRRYEELPQPGVLTGIARSNTGGDTLTWTYAFIPGSPFWDYTGNTGRFTIRGIPAGAYALQYFGAYQSMACPANICGPEILSGEADAVTVFPGQTTEVLK
jgi:hypothetical protein